MPSAPQATTPDEGVQASPFLTVAEIAEELRITELTTIEMTKRGAFPALRVGARGQYRVPRGAYEAWKEVQLAAINS